MKTKFAKKFMAIFFALCMVVSIMPATSFAAEGDTNITEVNINGVSGELWSYKDVPFATVDENSGYTIEKQEWYLNETDKITPTSENLKPKVGEKYTFNITLKAKDGYIFPGKSPEAKAFYGGVFKSNGQECDNSVVTVSTDGKTMVGLLFIDTTVKGVTDSPGGNVEIKTSVRDNYTDCQVTDNINLKKDSEYIIDFTKEDNLSLALRSMADLEGTKYYKFQNSDNNSLIETENVSEALIKIVGNKSENKAIMTLVSDVDKNTSYALDFMRTQYTGSKLTYTKTDYDEGTGKNTIYEIRDDYYTRYHFNCKLNIITAENNLIELVEINNVTLNFKPGDKPIFTGTIPDGSKYIMVYEAWKTDDEGISSDEFFNNNDHLPIWGGKLITNFEKGKTYKYMLYFKTTTEAGKDGWIFGPNTKLKVNGKEVAFVRDNSEDEYGQTFTVKTDLTMTPQESGTYNIIEGANSYWVQNTDGTLTFRIDGDISKFVGIKVDGSWVNSENYSVVSGSTVVTLKNEYLKTLSIDEHKITFVYTDGECSTNFKIKKSGEGYENSDNPQTGDNNMFLWSSLFSISILVMILTAIYNRKNKCTI